MPHVKLTLLYDGSCPICAWEQRNLARRDKHGYLDFVDIQSLAFDASSYGVTRDALMGRLHGFTADGRMLVGMETLLASYCAVGWWWVYLPLRLVPAKLAEWVYGWFADHRHDISRRIGHWFGPVCDTNSCRR